MISAPYRYLSTERAAEFVGDAAGVNRLLSTLKDTLDADVPKLSQYLADGNSRGLNDLLHQFKGFVPVFCVDDLVERVVEVEALSKHAPIEALAPTVTSLIDQLSVLQAEVASQIGA